MVSAVGQKHAAVACVPFQSKEEGDRVSRRAVQRMTEAFKESEERQACMTLASRADQRWLQRAVQRGEVVRPHRGIYVRTSYWNELDYRQKALHVLKALAQKHPDWVFAGTSAALVHGLEVGWADARRICVASTVKTHPSFKGMCTRIIVTGDTPVERDGVRVTSFTRTLYDCLRSLQFPEGLAIADSALRVKGIDAVRLAHNVERSCANRPDLHRVLSVISWADGRAENGGESKVRAHIILNGYALPELQYKVDDSVDQGREYYVDFAWKLADGSLVFGELDGKDKYTDPKMTGGLSAEDVLLRERRREARITIGDTPIRVMRFSFAEACDTAYFTHLLDTYGIPRTEDGPISISQGL